MFGVFNLTQLWFSLDIMALLLELLSGHVTPPAAHAPLLQYSVSPKRRPGERDREKKKKWFHSVQRVSSSKPPPQTLQTTNRRVHQFVIKANLNLLAASSNQTRRPIGPAHRAVSQIDAMHTLFQPVQLVRVSGPISAPSIHGHDWLKVGLALYRRQMFQPIKCVFRFSFPTQ